MSRDPQELTAQMQYQYLPPRWKHLRWFEMLDPTTLELGDVVFDPFQYAHYAGEIINVPDAHDPHPVWKIRWWKSDVSTIDDWQNYDHMLNFWFADPVMQDVGKCACGSSDCYGDCEE